MGWPLPEVVNPPDTVCVELHVPNDPHYLAAFWGAILDTTVGFNWANDSAHTAKRAAARMRQMYIEAQDNNCPVAPSPVGTVGVDGDDFMLRQDPDNPCLLQSSVDGVTWCTWADLSKCTPSNSNPPPTGTNPPPGGCATYHGQFTADQLALLPFVVNAGDTLQFVDISGAGNDAGGGSWYCPDGSTFFAGACAAPGAPAAGDPLGSANHMEVIVNVAGVFHRLITGLFTVPGGVSNGQVYLQVNDDTLAGNSGQYTYDVKWCNNAPAAPWRAKINFALHSGGFVPDTVAGGTPGVWTPGSGWAGALYQSGGLNLIGVAQHLLFSTAATITSCTMKTQITPGSSTASGSNMVWVQDNLGAVLLTNVLTFGALVSGENDVTATSTHTVNGIDILAGASECGTTGGCGGTVNVSELDLTGTGTPPAELVPYLY